MFKLTHYRRMKIIVILLGLLMGVLGYAQEKCQKEKHQVKYYVYNANVEITMYSCIISDIDNAQTCENHNYKKVVNDYSSVRRKCISNALARNDIFRRIYLLILHNKMSLCELTASVKLLEGTADISGVPWKYSNGSYYNVKYNHSVFSSNEVCQDLQIIHKDFFHVWTDRYRHKYIRSEQISLRLVEKLIFCGYEMWKTDYDGIIVSTNAVESSVVTNLSRKFQSTLPDDCDVTTKAVDNYNLQRENVLLKPKVNGSHRLTLLDYLMYVLYGFLSIFSLTITVTLFLSVQLLRLDPLETKPVT